MSQVRKSAKSKPAPRRRSAEAKALALKHFRQRKLPNKKRDYSRARDLALTRPVVTEEKIGPDDWFDFPDEGNDGC